MPATWTIVPEDDGLTEATATTEVLRGFYAGDKRTITRIIAGIPVGRTIDKVRFTIKTEQSLTASPLIQKTITSTLSAHGQIVFALGVYTLTVILVGSETRYLAGRRYYDCDIILDDGSAYTACQGRIEALRAVSREVSVASVSATPSPLTFLTTVPQQLTAIVRDAELLALSGRTVIWTSSNVYVAIVDSTGLVTPTGPGACTITPDCEGITGTAVVVSSLINAPRIVIDGNSHSAAGGGGLAAGEQWPAKLLTLPGMSGYETLNYAISGQETRQMATDFATQVAPQYDALRADNILIAWEITNDIAHFPGDTAASIYDTYRNYCLTARAAGFTVIAVTCLARGDVGAGEEATRISVNTLIRNGWAGFADALVDVTESTAFGQPGSTSDLIYFNADTIHLTPLTHALLAWQFYAAIDAVRASNPVVLPDGVETLMDACGGADSARIAFIWDIRRGWVKKSGSATDVEAIADVRLPADGGPTLHARATTQNPPGTGSDDADLLLTFDNVDDCALSSELTDRCRLDDGVTIVYIGSHSEPVGTNIIASVEFDDPVNSEFMCIETFDSGGGIGNYGLLAHGAQRLSSGVPVDTTRRVFMAFMPGTAAAGRFRILDSVNVSMAFTAVAPDEDVRITLGRAFFERPAEFQASGEARFLMVLQGAEPTVAEIAAIRAFALAYHAAVPI